MNVVDVVLSEVTVGATIMSTTVDIIGTDLVGPRGPAGVSAGATYKTAGAAVGGQRVLAFTSDGQVVHADPTNIGHRFLAMAMSVGAAASGAQVECRTVGEITEGAWSWTPGAPVYVGAVGVPTQIVPTAPSWQRQIGTATTPTTIFLQFHPTIIII